MQTSASHFFSISRNKDIPEPSPQAAATAPAIDPAKVPSGTTLRDNAIDKISRESLHWLAFSSAPASSVNVEPSGPASVLSEKLVNTCKARSHLPAALHVPIAQLYVMTSGSKARTLGADNRSNFPPTTPPAVVRCSVWNVFCQAVMSCTYVYMTYICAYKIINLMSQLPCSFL